MQFTPRGRNHNNQSQPVVNVVNDVTPQPHQAHQTPGRPKRHVRFGGRFIRVEIFVLSLSVAVLVLMVIIYTVLGGPSSESKQVNNKEYQAVFLNNGQVYFGKIKNLNSQYAVVTNVFYIENNGSNASQTQASNNNYTLRKLGTTELHAPEDKMVINRSTITFWENLKDSSQVVSKINDYYKNPSGSSPTTTPTTTPSTTPGSNTKNSSGSTTKNP